jgi:hypothetical protein
MGERTIIHSEPDIVGDLVHGQKLPVNAMLKGVNWDDLRIPLTATKRGGAKDPPFGKIADNGAGSTGVYAYLFDAGSEQELFFSTQLPHRFVPNSEIRPHIHWKSTTTGGGGVVWGLELMAASVDANFPTNTVITWVRSVASGIIARHQVAILPPFTLPLTESAMLIGRIFRDATGALGTDDYAGDAAGLELDFHIQVHKMGTVTEYPT